MHYKNTCPKSQAISQCRCSACNKVVTQNVCPECKIKEQKVKAALKKVIALTLPTSSENLTQDEVVKMLYLASGWVKDNLAPKSTGARFEADLEKMALIVHDFERSDVTYAAAKKPPEMETLKKNKVKLTPDERNEVMKAKAVWHHGIDGAETPAVWKAVVKGQTWYVTDTHRAYQAKKTLKSAINAYHNFIKSTA